MFEKFTVEYLSLITSTLAIVQAIHRQETGRFLYWLGAFILTLGIIKMSG